MLTAFQHRDSDGGLGAQQSKALTSPSAERNGIHAHQPRVKPKGGL